MSVSTVELAHEIKRRNPKMSLADIARICGTSRQAIHQYLSRKQQTSLGEVYFATPYEAEVAFARRTILTRGRIWERARPAFEDGSYQDGSLARMLEEGVIVPAADPDGGYILPTTSD